MRAELCHEILLPKENHKKKVAPVFGRMYNPAIRFLYRPVGDKIGFER
jgi:hypothetical protein